MKKFIIILAALVLAATSCEKQFEEVRNTSTLTGSQATEISEQDPSFLASYINGFYAHMVAYGGRHDDYGYLALGVNSDMMGEDIAINGPWNFGTYDINHDYGEAPYVRCAAYWNFAYTLIKKANEVIEFFGEEDPTNPVLRSYLGQAYALRAFAYSNLIYWFQDPVDGEYPNATFRDSAPGTPIVYAIRDGKSVEESEAVSGRNTLADLKAEAERNIALALPLLKDNCEARSTKNFVNYEVAQGIAARYYLLSQQWAKAADAAAAAQTGFDIMDESRLKAGLAEIEDKEVMWGFNHTTETSTVYASFFSHMCNEPEAAGYGGIGQSTHCIDRRLYEQIPADDYRQAWFNGPAGDATAGTSGASRPYASRKFGWVANFLQDYTFMRASEMILIEAEALARQNNGAAAATALKKLMIKRVPGWAQSSVSVDDVILQRRIELWGEGFEYFDRRRNGLGVDRTYAGTNHSAAAQYKFPAHAISWYFQIPRSEMQNNQFITDEEQNPWISGVSLDVNKND